MAGNYSWLLQGISQLSMIRILDCNNLHRFSFCVDEIWIAIIFKQKLFWSLCFATCSWTSLYLQMLNMAAYFYMFLFYMDIFRLHLVSVLHCMFVNIPMAALHVSVFIWMFGLHLISTTHCASLSNQFLYMIESLVHVISILKVIKMSKFHLEKIVLCRLYM